MNKNNEAIAEAYYTAMGEKNIAGTEKHLHPDVQFSSPLGKMMGKEAVLDAIKKFTTLFKTLTIRAKFGSENQATIIYDLECSEPIGKLSAAALMTFKDGLIVKIELFFDARPFDKN